MQESRLISKLASEGTFDSRGAFTLDRAKAKEKMRTFQLPDPHWFVLMFASGAAALGATRIAFTVDGNDVKASFDGEPLPQSFMDDPWSSLFLSQERAECEGERDIAVGVNAALSTSPHSITVESQGRALLITEKGESSTTPSAPAEGTRIHVKSRACLRTAQRLLKGLVSPWPEVAILKEKCPWARAALEVNGAAITRAPGFPDALVSGWWSGTSGDGGAEKTAFPVSGWFAVPRDADAGWSLSLVKHGVHVADRFIADRTPPLTAVVYADSLLRNASMSDIVEDGRYRLLLKSLEAAADAMISALGERFSALNGNLQKKAAALYLREAARLVKKGTRDRWWSIPLIPQAAAGKPLTLEGLAAEKTVYCCAISYDFPHPEGKPLALTEDRNVLNALKALPGVILQNVDKLMASARTREENRRSWESRKSLVRLTVPCLVRAFFSHETTSGEVGLPMQGDPGARSSILVHMGGRFLVERKAELPTFVHCAVNDDSLTPDFTWEDVEEDAAYGEMVRRIDAQAKLLYRKIAERLEKKAEQSPELSLCREYILDRMARLAAGNGDLAPFRETPLFPTLAGNHVSLDELGADGERFGAVHCITQSSPGPQADGRIIVIAKPQELKILEHAFARNLVDYTRGLHDERVRMENLSRARTPAVIEDAVLCKVALREEGISGEVGLLPRDERRKPKAAASSVTFLKEERVIAKLGVPLPLEPVAAAVNDDRLAVNARWDKVEQDDAYRRVIAAVEKTLPALAVEAARSLGKAQPPERAQMALFILDFLVKRGHEWRKLEKTALAPLVEAPLLRTVSGESTSLAAVARQLESAGKVGYVRTSLTVTEKLDAPVLVVNDSEWERVRALVPAESLVNMKAALQEIVDRESFMRQSVEEARLEGAEWLDRIVIDRDGVRGELGIPSADDEKGLSAVRLLKSGRYLAHWRGASDILLRGVLDCPALEPVKSTVQAGQRERDLRSVEENDALARVERIIEEAPAELVEALLSVLPSLDRERRRLVPQHLCRYLERMKVKAPDLGKDAPSLPGRIAAAPLFRDSLGRDISLREIAQQYEGATFIPYTESEEKMGLLDGSLRVIRLTAAMRQGLQTLLPRTRNYTKELQLDAEAAKILARATPVRKLELTSGGPYIARRAVREEGLAGEIALSESYRKGTGVTLVYNGHAIATKPLWGELCLSGIIAGPLQVERTFKDANLTSRQSKALLDAVDGLYRELATSEKLQNPASRRHLLDYLLFRKGDLLRALRQGATGSFDALLDLRIFRLAGGGVTTAARVLEEILRSGALKYCTAQGAFPSEGALVILAEKEWEVDVLKRLSPGGAENVTAAAQKEAPKKKPFYDAPLGDVIADAVIRVVDTLIPDAKAPAEKRTPQEEKKKPGKKTPSPRHDPLAVHKRRLLDALRVEFCLFRRRSDHKIGDTILDGMAIEPLASPALVCFEAETRRVRLNEHHPLMARILTRFEEDGTVLPIVMSSIYSAINRALLEVEDIHEIRFQMELARHLIDRLEEQENRES